MEPFEQQALSSLGFKQDNGRDLNNRLKVHYLDAKLQLIILITSF